MKLYNPTFISSIKKTNFYWKFNLNVFQKFITSENINLILRENCEIDKISLLSIDIDGNDYWVWKAGMPETPIDVKARKKIKRKDTATNDSFIWVEFTSVNGSKGWLYGKSEFIAFETEDNFLVVRRSALASLCERLCNTKELNQHGSKPPLYVGYQRYGRKDLVSLIKLEDILENLPHSFILK
jgi:hypothetical protein